MDTNPNGKRPTAPATTSLTAAPPPRHRRALSDSSSFFLDDLLLNFDPSDFDLSSALNLPTANAAVAPMAVDNTSESSSSTGAVGLPKSVAPTRHARSLSVDSEFFEKAALGFEEKGLMGERKVLHRRSGSMDGFTSASFEADIAGATDGPNKALSNDKLAELASIDPKKAKRILANRQSAARSKERKQKYTYDLERKMQALETGNVNLSAQVINLQREATGLTNENRELKLRLQAMEQQSKLKEALSEALGNELQQLKIAAGETSAVNRNPFHRGLPQFSSHRQALYHSGKNQMQQQQSQQSATNPPVSQWVNST